MTAPTLFDPPTMQDVERDLVRLARNRGEYGITADDVVHALRKHQLAWRVGREEQRRFSNTGKLLRQIERGGGLRLLTHADGSPVMRKSERPEAHGNLQRVYVAAEGR